MNPLCSLCIGPTATARQALEVIDQVAAQMALVVDEHARLIGTVTDGDIRRLLLRAGAGGHLARRWAHAFKKVCVAVNDTADVMEPFLGTGDGCGVESECPRESERLWTAGALSVLQALGHPGILHGTGGHIPLPAPVEV